MKRIANWALPLLLISVLSTSAIAQAQAQAPKWKNTKEYDDFMLVYNERDPAKKAANAEKFFVDHKDADPIALEQNYQMMILSYAGAGNAAKMLEAAEKVSQLAPNVDPAFKNTVNLIALQAASSLKNNPKTLEYAEKILAGNPNEVNALLTLSGLLSNNLPTDAGPKAAQMTRALDVTRKALAQPKPANIPETSWTPVQVQLHRTSCLLLLNQVKYEDSMAECQAALKLSPKDGDSYYLIGLSKKAQLVELAKKYSDANTEYNNNRTKDQITVDELKAKMDGAEKAANDKRDETIDAFARAVAAGGGAIGPAREELQRLFKGTSDELNSLIQEKKVQLG